MEDLNTECACVRVCVGVCACVIVYTSVTALKLRHLLPSTFSPSVQMDFKQTNMVAENELAPLLGHSECSFYQEVSMWFPIPAS